jgi:transcription antitermination protein NusB
LAREARGGRSRQRARELLVKALYQWQLAGHSAVELLAQFGELAEFPKCDAEYFERMLEIVLDDVPALDELIGRYAVRGVDQLDAVGRAVLLLGLAELKHREDVPPKVAINEAVELAKRYGAAESFKFINAVMDRASRDMKRDAAKANA